MTRIPPHMAAAHSQAQRERILAAARELFASAGYEAVSMRKIAALIGQSPTTIYLYFRDKRDLVTQIAEEFFAHLVAALETELAAPATTPREALERGLRCYVRVALDHPSHYRAALLNPIPSAEASEIEQGNMSQAAQGFLVHAITHILPAGTAPERVAAMANACWSALHGLVAMLILSPQCFCATPEATIDAMVTLLADGLTNSSNSVG